MPAQFPRRPQIYLPPNRLGELHLNPHQTKISRDMLGFEINQHVDIAAFPKSRSQHRSEERKLPYVMALAERGKRRARNSYRKRNHAPVIALAGLVRQPREAR